MRKNLASYYTAPKTAAPPASPHRAQARLELVERVAAVDEEDADLLDVGLDVTRFFRNESCGKCVPCRVGTEEAVTTLERGPLTEEQVVSLRSLHATLARTSICGLGQVALAPLLSLIDLQRGGGRG